MRAVWKRELRNYFLTPIGYVFMGIFLLVSGLFFMLNNLWSASSDLAAMFQMLNYVFMLIVPLLTMRLLSEERKNKTDQLLLTSPISIWSIVTGKFLAASSVLVLSLVFTGVYIAIIALFGTAYWGLILANYIGFLMLGASYIAIGVLVSALTESQLSAAVLTFGANLMLQFLESVAPQVSIPGVPWLSSAMSWLSLYSRYYSFTAGVISLADIIYYVSFIGVLLFLTVRIIDKRRWSEG